MTTRPKPRSYHQEAPDNMFRRDRSSRSGSSREHRARYSSSEKPADDYVSTPPHQSSNPHHSHLPFHHPKKKTKGINAEGESNRSGFHPLKFLWIVFRSASKLSMAVNVLWPIVPAAIAVHFAYQYSHDRNKHVLIFVLNYIAMIPAANTIGFAGQELARKLPRTLGVLMETSLGSITEIIIFVTLVAEGSLLPVVRSAILGSILANLLLCLGLCFIAGGLKREEQVFHEAVSEVGSGLLLVAGFGLIVPAAFATVFSGTTSASPINAMTGSLTNPVFQKTINDISRATAIVLLIAFIIYVFFQTTSHESLYDEVLEADEQRDKDGHKDKKKAKLTLVECIIALVISVACTALIAVFLVSEIPHIIGQSEGNRHYISEAFMGLILVPLVEKAAEHLTAIDEAWDNQANFALTHVLGASIQTALLNAPIAVFVSWGIHKYHPSVVTNELDFNFRPFEAIVLILAIIVVGSFLRDGKSNYLEGVLCVCVYVIVAVCAYYFEPETFEMAGEQQTAEAGGEGHGGGEAPAAEAVRLLARAVIG